MRRKLFFTGSMVALSLVCAAVLILHPTRAKSETNEKIGRASCRERV